MLLIICDRPLHHSFASPFVASMSAVPLEQDFAIPSCYNVANVQPLQSRIPSFSDETLFYIFYSMPRDVLQELVAEELMGRKWRYHKVERCWLTRDENYPGPVDVERGVSERGVYLWWDPASWKKIRVCLPRSLYSRFFQANHCLLARIHTPLRRSGQQTRSWPGHPTKTRIPSSRFIVVVLLMLRVFIMFVYWVAWERAFKRLAIGVNYWATVCHWAMWELHYSMVE